MESDIIHLEYHIFQKWVTLGMEEIIERFNLKLPDGFPNYPYYYFTKKNSNRYFKKHLGFVYGRNIKTPYRYGAVYVTNYKKLMLFRLKYDL